MRRTTRLCSTVLALALLFAGCGDDDSDEVPADDAMETTDDGVDDPIDDGQDDTTGEIGTGPLADDAYIVLNANGIETDEAVVSFGDDADFAIALATRYWGEPDTDSGDQPSSQDCLVSGDTFRRVVYGDVMIIFVDGTLDYWMSTDPDQSTEAFVGDSTTVLILPGHTTVADLRGGLGEAVTVADEPPLGPSFFLTDNFGTMFGEVDDIGDAGIVQSVSAGVGCGE